VMIDGVDKKMSRIKFVSLFLVAGFAFNVPSFAALNNPPLNNSSVTVNWGYKGNIGPTHWGVLDSRFELCSTGHVQSPISIPKKVVNVEHQLRINYQSAPLTIIEDGAEELDIGKQAVMCDEKSVQLQFHSGHERETIQYRGKQYRLVQLHFHSPSENELRGQTYPLEIHFVHQGEQGELAVIGVFVKGGQANPSIQEIIDHLPSKHGIELTTPGQYINPSYLLPANGDYYSFDGSLTTPPCTEGVHWVVMKNTIEASPAQIVLLRKALGGGNARPVQPLKGRVISFATESKA
jgi:carbonic anhydrase